MTTEQLVSFINYQIGQKQGWESLAEVIGIVNDAQQLVAKATKDVAIQEQAVADMKASLAAMDETLAAKEKDHQSKLDSKEESHKAHLAKLSQAAKLEVDTLKGNVVALQAHQVAAQATADKLSAIVIGLERQKTAAEAELGKVHKQLADIKASI